MKILLNGFGRIGRAITRILIQEKFKGEIYISNRTHNPKLLLYLLQHDSLYGNLNEKIDKEKLKFISNDDLQEIFEKKNQQFDFFIDTTPNINFRYQNLIDNNIVKKVVISHMSDQADFTCVFGMNEHMYDSQKNHIVSMGICDVVALSPILNFMNKIYGIEAGTILTIL